MDYRLEALRLCNLLVSPKNQQARFTFDTAVPPLHTCKYQPVHGQLTSRHSVAPTSTRDSNRLSTLALLPELTSRSRNSCASTLDGVPQAHRPLPSTPTLARCSKAVAKKRTPPKPSPAQAKKASTDAGRLPQLELDTSRLKHSTARS